MQINDQLLERIDSVPSPAIIAVSGFGGSGKSSLSARLGQYLRAPVISVDSFIRSRHLTDYSRWGWMDYDRLENEVLRPLTSGCKSISYGHFDWSANQIVPRTITPDGHQTIVEGVGLLRPSLVKYFAFSIWIFCPLEEATARGKRRDCENHMTSPDERWDGIWRRNDEECYALFQPESVADHVFDNSVREA